MDSQTLCLVERTGFERGKVDLKEVEARLAPACVEWLTPQRTLVHLLNRRAVSSISRFIIYSHGLPGAVTLRYGWGGCEDYGLKPSEIGALRKDIFTAEAELEINSCNAGSYSDEGILAQNLATHVSRAVKAWTGRTSYREVNDGEADGDTSIIASDASRGGPRWLGGWDKTELWRQGVEGRVPEFVTFRPLDEFQSSFEFSASIPEGRHTLCAAEGTSIEVTLENTRYTAHSLYTPTQKVYVTLYRRDPALLDADENLGTKEFTVGQRKTQVWSGLKGGWYYLGMSKDNTAAMLGYETIAGTVHARVRPR